MVAGFLLAALASATSATLPAQYRGAWTAGSGVCRADDTEVVHIGARSIDGDEAHGEVRSASAGAKGLSARVAFTGEGRDWTEAVTLHPLAGGRLALTAFGRTATYRRCRTGSAR